MPSELRLLSSSGSSASPGCRYVGHHQLWILNRSSARPLVLSLASDQGEHQQGDSADKLARKHMCVLINSSSFKSWCFPPQCSDAASTPACCFIFTRGRRCCIKLSVGKIFKSCHKSRSVRLRHDAAELQAETFSDVYWTRVRHQRESDYSLFPL